MIDVALQNGVRDHARGDRRAFIHSIPRRSTTRVRRRCYVVLAALSRFIAFSTSVRFFAEIIHDGSELASVEFRILFSAAAASVKPKR